LEGAVELFVDHAELSIMALALEMSEPKKERPL
jgi:hypothetical protein